MPLPIPPKPKPKFPITREWVLDLERGEVVYYRECDENDPRYLHCLEPKQYFYMRTEDNALVDYHYGDIRKDHPLLEPKTRGSLQPWIGGPKSYLWVWSPLVTQEGMPLMHVDRIRITLDADTWTIHDVTVFEAIGHAEKQRKLNLKPMEGVREAANFYPKPSGLCHSICSYDTSEGLRIGWMV